MSVAVLSVEIDFIRPASPGASPGGFMSPTAPFKFSPQPPVPT